MLHFLVYDRGRVHLQSKEENKIIFSFISDAQRDWGKKENSGGIVICHHIIFNNMCGAHKIKWSG